MTINAENIRCKTAYVEGDLSNTDQGVEQIKANRVNNGRNSRYSLAVKQVIVLSN